MATHMRTSTILSFYVGRQFLANFLFIFFVFLGLMFLFDVVELLRKASAKPHVTFGLVSEMALLRIPHLGQKLFPFAVLFGGMLTFWRLTRSNELVVTRAAGVSAWQFLFPVLLSGALLGATQVGALNPLASLMLSRYERLEAKHFKGQTSALAISPTGLWLRQAGTQGPAVIHADGVSHQGRDVELRGISIFAYQGNNRFNERIEAQTGRLEDGFWHLKEVWHYTAEGHPRFLGDHWFETDLTIGKIQDSFAPPETMSFWELPKFIGTLEAAGFTALRHRLHWHIQLATPLLLCAMVLIAATFSLRHHRRGGTVYIIGGGVLTAFLLHFFSDIVFALGLSDSIPVTLAAWTPSGVSTLLGLAMLLHLEDG